jgi:hypothetical protein
MKSRIIFSAILGILLFGFLTLGCDKLITTKIGDIVNNTRGYAEKFVTIEGEVTEVFSLHFVKYFKVSDGTGEIAVVSNKPSPLKGNNIKVYGQVKEAFSLGDERLLVIIEED